jgi:SAM-dependent methyltransferase
MNTRCRFCDAPLHDTVADLGMSPLANSYLTESQDAEMEPFYPLRALVCGSCFLVQLGEYQSPSHIFSEYAYFSSYSSSYLAHAAGYTESITERLGLGAGSLVVELASNDGYLLQYFVERGIPVVGIEPAANVAEVAVAKGIPTIVEFFGRKMAEASDLAAGVDLIVANNVLAHVPDLNDFVAGIGVLLKPSGVATLEFPHLMQLLDHKQFDTIYHEHFSYFSLSTVRRVFARHGMTVFDVEEIPTHGGSLRIYVGHDGANPVTDRTIALEQREQLAGLCGIERYLAFADEVKAEKRAILTQFIQWKDGGLKIAGYGAPAKGNTLLNYCGIGTDFIDFTVDRNPHKQGHFLPGSHIPVRAPEAIEAERPDLVVILPWNIKDEIMREMAFVRGWGGRFAARTPEFAVLE